MEVCITKRELEIALRTVNNAIENGFTDSSVILKLYKGGRALNECMVETNGVILKTDSTDFGRVKYPEWYKLIDGECKCASEFTRMD